ncbi:MAG: response regulator transcription factor [Bacteroidia bacterium]
MADKTNILLAEDDLNLGILLVEYLESEGFAVKLCRDGEIASKTFQSGEFDVCILDIMLPKKDGYTVAKQIRQLNSKIPILFLSAKSLKEDKVKGFDIGADDYITKPFEEEELLCRIKAVIRRTGDTNTKPEPAQFNIGKYIFDYDNQALKIGGTTKRITEKESEILRYLCNNKNKLVKRDELLIAVWGVNDYFLGRSLDVFITKIRKYLKEDSDITIENIHGVGFILNTEKS